MNEDSTRHIVHYQKFIRGVFSQYMAYGTFNDATEAVNWLLDKNFNYPERGSDAFLRKEDEFTIGVAHILPLKKP